MLRTLTRTIGQQKLVVIEDRRLSGQNYGKGRKRAHRILIRVSPAVFKLLQDDFDAVAKDFDVIGIQRQGIA